MDRLELAVKLEEAGVSSIFATFKSLILSIIAAGASKMTKCDAQCLSVATASAATKPLGTGAQQKVYGAARRAFEEDWMSGFDRYSVRWNSFGTSCRGRYTGMHPPA
jgi:hypothetical protein